MIRDHSHASFPFAQPNPDVPLSAGIVDGNHNGCAQNAPLSEAQTAAALHSLKEELANLPHREKSPLVHAQQINPDLVDDEHLLSFLQAECFNVGVRSLTHHYILVCFSRFPIAATVNALPSCSYYMQLALKRLDRTKMRRGRVARKRMDSVTLVDSTMVSKRTPHSLI